MNPLVSTILSILFLIVGGIAVAMMLSVQGRGKLQNPKLVIRIHKAMGWAYVALFLVLFFFMLGRIGGYWEESSARIALHVALSVGLFFLLIEKVIIPRSFPRLGKHLFSFGVAVGMIAWSSLLNLPKIKGKQEKIIKWLNISIAIIAIVYGIYLLLGGEGINLIAFLA